MSDTTGSKKLPERRVGQVWGVWEIVGTHVGRSKEWWKLRSPDSRGDYDGLIEKSDGRWFQSVGLIRDVYEPDDFNGVDDFATIHDSSVKKMEPPPAAGTCWFCQIYPTALNSHRCADNPAPPGWWIEAMKVENENRLPPQTAQPTQAMAEDAQLQERDQIRRTEYSNHGAAATTMADIPPDKCWICLGSTVVLNSHRCADHPTPPGWWIEANHKWRSKNPRTSVGGTIAEALRPVLKVMRFHPDATIPIRGTPESSGLDLYAIEDRLIRRGEVAQVKTGIGVEIPVGYEAQVRPRSSMAIKGVVAILGTIDRDYRGALTMPMVSYFQDYWIKKGDRVAQLVLAPVLLCDVEEVKELAPSHRGDKGFGSTGTAGKPTSSGSPLAAVLDQVGLEVSCWPSHLRSDQAFVELQKQQTKPDANDLPWWPIPDEE